MLILVGIVILAMASGGAFYLGRQTSPKLSPVVTSTVSPSPKDASPVPTGTGETANPATGEANWKTYTDLKNGFSFKYPASWINFKFKNPTTNIEYGAFSTEQVSDYNQLSDISIIVLVNPQEARKLSAIWKEIAVDGKQAGRQSFENMCPGSDKYCATWSDTIIFKDKSLSISLTSRTLEAVQNNEQIFNQILSTFKFIQ